MSYLPTGQMPNFEGKALSLMERRIELEKDRLKFQRKSAFWAAVEGLSMMAIPVAAFFGFQGVTKLLKGK